MRGTHPELAHDLATWCRQQGHRWHPADTHTDGIVGSVERGSAAGARWVGAERAGRSDPGQPDAVAAAPPAAWGLAARGAAIEPGGPEPDFRLDHRDEVWTDRAPTLYAQAVAAQWDPDTAIDWSVADRPRRTSSRTPSCR